MMSENGLLFRMNISDDLSHDLPLNYVSASTRQASVNSSGSINSMLAVAGVV